MVKIVDTDDDGADYLEEVEEYFVLSEKIFTV